MPNQVAEEGQVFVCTAYGKRSKDRYGELKISEGWDESCMLKALLCWEDKLIVGKNGLVVGIPQGGVVRE